VRFATMPPVAAATAGAVCISSSAVLMKLASTASPSVVAFGRCAFALPVLGVLAMRERGRRPGHGRGPGHGPGPGRGGGETAPMARRSRWLARLAGVFLAADLILWSHTIAAIGAGLGTVVGNLAVLIIALLAWLVLGERPGRSLVLASPVMLAGLVLVGGLADVGGSHAYGTDPALGAGLGVGVAVLYAVYILMLRQATSAAGAGTAVAGAGTAVATPLFEATVGGAAGSVLLGLVLGDLHLGPPWPALGWIVLLALSSQVVGWLLITVSMPRLAAGTIGALLLIQPAGSVALSYVILGERPSLLQLAGVALVLTGVVVAVTGRSPDTDRAPEAGYSRRRTRIIRHASAASTDTSPSKSP
jgi:drug/metabolite transporter (DMT)-like permease